MAKDFVAAKLQEGKKKHSPARKHNQEDASSI
jgi:hypothetical protein